MNKPLFSSPSLRIALAYLVVAALWIPFSSELVGMTAGSPQAAALLETAKGWAFVVVTSVLLYLVLNRDFSRRRSIEVVHDDTRGALLDSQSRYARLATVSPVGIFRVNQNGLCLDVNQRWCEIVGLSAAQARGASWLQAIHPEDRDRVSRDWQEAVQARRPFRSEYRYQKRDGKTTWVISEAVLNVLDDATDFLGVITDITAQKQAELALKQAADHYQLLFEQSPIPSLIFDVDTLKFLAVNDRAIGLYGYSRDEFLNLTARDIRPSADIPLLMERVARLPPNLTTFGPVRHHAKDGTIISVELTSNNVSYQGRQARLVAINNVTDRIEAEAEIRHHNRELEAMLSLSSALTGRFDLELILDSITHATRDLLPSADHASLWLYDPKRRRLVFRAGSGFSQEVPPDFAIATDVGLIGQVFRTRQLINTAHASLASEFNLTDNEELDRRRSVIGVPLLVEGVAIGCLFSSSATRTDAFSDDDVRLLHTLASHAAVAIHEGQLYERLQSELADRLRTEQALSRSEELYRLASKATPNVALWDWDVATDKLDRSDGIESVFGYKRGMIEPMLSGWVKAVHSDDRVWVLKSLLSAVNGSESNWHQDYRIRRGNGTYTFVSDRAFIVRDQAGRAIRVIGSMVDVSEQKAADEALHQTEERFRRIAESAPDMIFRWSFTHGFEYVSPASTAITGFRPEDFYASPDFIRQMTHPEDASILDTIFADAPAHSELRSETLRWFHKSGKIVYVELRVMPLLDDHDEVYGIEGIAHDDSQHVLATTRLRELGQRLVSAQDKERRRVALELHDEVGQMLTVARMRLRLAIKTPPEKISELRTRLTALGTLLDESLNVVRSLSHELHPPLLAEMGWEPALAWLCESLSNRSSLDVTYSHVGPKPRMPAEKEIAIYRIAQEALTNALRHSSATKVRVFSRVSRRMLTIRIEDNGSGFDADGVQSAGLSGLGLGLLSIQERADSMAANVELDSKPGHGTKIKVQLPLSVKG